MLPFIARRRVQFSETDMAGIVHFANFYRWMEEAEHEFFRSRGLSIMVQQPDGTYIGWPRVSASMQFEAPVHYGEELEVRLTVDRIGFKSLNFLIEVWRDDRRLANGKMKTACCLCRPDGTLQSIEIPQSYREQLTIEN